MKIVQALWGRLVRTGFYLLYNPLAPAYDTISWLVSLGHWRDWQMAALPYLQGDSVLELAHGPGHMLLALEHAGFDATGIDLSPQMGRIARSRIEENGLHVAVLRAPAQRLPFVVHCFDSVLATFPAEFIVETATLGEVSRVLRQNGRFVFVPEARLTSTSPAASVLEFLYRVTGQRNEPTRGQSVESAITRWKMLRDRFKSAGFEVRIERVSLDTSEVTVIIATKMVLGNAVSESDES